MSEASENVKDNSALIMSLMGLPEYTWLNTAILIVHYADEEGHMFSKRKVFGTQDRARVLGMLQIAEDAARKEIE